MVFTLVGLAALVYIWKSRRDVKEFFACMWRGVTWCRRLIKPVLYLVACIGLCWSCYNAYFEYKVQAWVKANPQQSKRAEDLSYLSPKQRLETLHGESIAAYIDAISEAEQAGYSDDDIHRYLDSHPDVFKRVGDLTAIMVKLHPERANWAALAAKYDGVEVEAGQSRSSKTMKLPPGYTLDSEPAKDSDGPWSKYSSLGFTPAGKAK